MFFSQTVHRHEKSIAVPWWSPCLVAVARQLFYGEIANGSSQELHIRLRIDIIANNPIDQKVVELSSSQPYSLGEHSMYRSVFPPQGA
jgi:hypothetical protein